MLALPITPFQPFRSLEIIPAKKKEGIISSSTYSCDRKRSQESKNHICGVSFSFSPSLPRCAQTVRSCAWTYLVVKNNSPVSDVDTGVFRSSASANSRMRDQGTVLKITITDLPSASRSSGDQWPDLQETRGAGNSSWSTLSATQLDVSERNSLPTTNEMRLLSGWRKTPK